MRNKFAKIVDLVAISLTAFIFFFAWVRFYTHNITLAILLALVISAGLTFLLNCLFNKREEKTTLDKTAKLSAEALGLSLLGSTQKEILDFFYTEFSKNNKIVKRGENYLILEENSAQNEMHSTCIVPLYKGFSVELPDIIAALKLARILVVKDIKIYGIEFSSECKNFLSSLQNFNVSLVNQYEMYSSLSPAPLPVTFDTNRRKLNKREIIDFVLNKKRAKNYLLFGLVLLLTSFLVPFKIYYLVMGSLLSVFGIVVRIIPLIRKKTF